MANRFTTPQLLADHLDVDERYVRSVLREVFPERAPGKGSRWELTVKMCQTVERRAKAMKKRRAARQLGL